MAPTTRGKKVAPPKKDTSKKVTSSKGASSSKKASTSKKTSKTTRKSLPPKGVSNKPFALKRPLSRTPPPPSLRVKDAIWSEEEKEERELFEEVYIEPTKTMRKELLQKLGLYEEVCYLLGCMGLFCLIDMKEPLYEKEVKDFISTMEIVFNAPRKPKPMYGFLRFKIGDKEYSMSLLEVCKTYEFPFGEEAKFPYWGGINIFWDLIADGPYINKNPPASKIRNPVIRYVQRLLAGTLFGRLEGCKPLRNEVFLIFRGLVENLNMWDECVEYEDFGSNVNVGWLFLRYMKSFQGKWVRSTTHPVIYFGSMLTPLFKRANVPLGEANSRVNYIEVKDLVSCGFLRVNKRTLGLEYIFHGFGSGKKMFLPLPCDEKSSITSMDNVIFTYSGEEIERENSNEVSSSRTQSETITQRRAPDMPTTSNATLQFVPQTSRERDILKAVEEERRAFEEKIQREIEELKRQVLGMQSQSHQGAMLSAQTEGSAAQADTTQAAEALATLAAMKEPTARPPISITYKRLKKKRATIKESSS